MSRDTSPAVEKFLRERYARLSGAERVVMGADMFETARAFVLASLPSGLPPQEVRRRLCERFYGTLAERVYGKK
ncbi:MAG TPA: hypothetical protein VK138_13390 [Acidiferrobacterales bacterium]|nr:hypothetical protein [Acidiferrobacterales bacterium]